MKKVLSIVLSVAMLMTVACAMFVTPASAEVCLDLTADGPIVFTATAAGEEMPFWPENPGSISTYPFIELSVSSDVPFDIYFGDGNNAKGMFAAGDFCWSFPGGTTSAIPAGDYTDILIDLSGAYTWTGNPVPDNAALDTITLIAKEAGTMTVTKLKQTDGVKEVNFGELKNTYDTTVDLAVKDPAAWSLTDPSKNGGANAVVTADENALYVGTDAPGWPSVYMDYAEGITVDANATLYADFTVDKPAQTTIYLFFNGSTANAFNDGEYYALVADATTGHYSGYVTLSEVLPEGCYNEDGTITLTSVKIFGTDNATTTGNAAAVTVNALDLLYTAPEEPALPGDLNDNGRVEMREVLRVYQAASADGVGSLTADQVTLCDTNGNGRIDMRDVMTIYKTV